MSHPVTPAIRFLRQHNVEFIPHEYPYEEHGGTAQTAEYFNVDEHMVIKTIVLENELKKGLIVLMHGDCQISTRNLARALGFKHIEPAAHAQANKWSGYMIGGTSPFGTRANLPVYVEQSIMELERIFINGGKRGFLVEINPKDLNTLNPDYVSVAINKQND